MRTVQALAVTLLAPLGFVTTDAATDSIQPPAEESVPEDTAAVVPAGPEVSSWPTVTVIGADATDRAVLDEALTAFRANGLELPDVEIRYSGDRADCNGHLGLFENWYTPWRLLVCTDAAYVTYHELAHAWEAANIDDDTRARYLEARNLSTWSDPDTPWAERGIEDVARLLQVSLMTKRPHLDSAIWQERLAAYELLTGRRSPALDRAVPEAATANPTSDTSADDRTVGMYERDLQAPMTLGRRVASVREPVVVDVGARHEFGPPTRRRLSAGRCSVRA